MTFVSPISKRAKTPTTKHSPLSSQHGGTLKISGKNHWPLSPGLLVGRTDIFCKPQPVANILRQKPAMESIQVTMCPYHHLSCLPELDIFWQWIQYTQLKRSLEIFDHLINLYVFCSIKQQRMFIAQLNELAFKNLLFYREIYLSISIYIKYCRN